VIVAKRDTPLPPDAAPAWEEPDEPAHPLLGIVTALEQADGRAVVVCACDLPFLSPALVARVAGLDAPLAIHWRAAGCIRCSRAIRRACCPRSAMRSTGWPAPRDAHGSRPGGPR